MPGPVFISHSSRDDTIVAAIRDALMACGVDVWDDARQLVAGDLLEPELLRVLDESRALVAVLSPRTINSKWVTKEIRYALDLQKQRGPAYKVIPVMVDGIESSGLDHWFPEEPLGLKLEVGPGGIQNALPALLDALGLSLPIDSGRAKKIEALPIADLTLELSDPFIDRSGGKHRAGATAVLIYKPAETGARDVRSRRFELVAPLGPIEAEDLRWYLERYVSWPTGVFRERAKGIEARLPEWGRMLHAAALEHQYAREAYEAWKRCGNGAVRRLTILVDRDLIASSEVGDEEKKKSRQADADEAASLFLGLPWELLHDDEGYLFQGPYPVRVRRALPNRKAKPAFATAAPLRVLLISPRPEDDRAAYIDHRVSARPVVEALAPLGELAELTLLSPPTFAALTKELNEAQQRGEPYHVVHFDGHGVYSQKTGLGALCFELAEDSEKIERRRSDIVDAKELAEVMRDHRVPLFFLEACQSAVSEKDPTASVAGTLLQGGVASVVAMSHSVLIETARRFVTEFYQELLAGRRIGEAMVEGQRELKSNTFRFRTFQGDLNLEDWFVPVLYQEDDDPQLISEVPAQRVREVLEKHRDLSLGELPAAPEHGFVGRSRELLKAERLLHEQRFVVLRGEGGEGKTTLAVELARWLVAIRRYERAAFVSLERDGDARSLLFALGSQLVPNFGSLAGQDEDRGWLHVERALKERMTLVVLDNMESVLPPEPGAAIENAFEPDVLKKMLEVSRKIQSSGETRVLFTSRQAMPAPFANNHISIGRLGRGEAIDLVARTLGREQQTPRKDDPGESEDEVSRLVDAVGCHARSLLLLAREVAESGVRSTTEQLGELMARLQRRHPKDREQSLFASVELSLKRLPAGMREAIRPLGMFQGGGHQVTMALVLGLKPPKLIQAVAEALVRVGLAEHIEYGYLRLDPALGPLLLRELDDAERDAARNRWAIAMAEHARFLYEKLRSDPKMASVLTLSDLTNLLVALEQLAATETADVVVAFATSVEGLLANRGRPKALARASRVREKAASTLSEWSHAQSVALRQVVTRLLEEGRFQEAVAMAKLMLERALSGGDVAYELAAYDLAMAHFSLGRALQMSGAAKAALVPLRDARDRFQGLANGGDQDAVAMATAVIADIGDCLLDLGRLDEAALEYEESIRRAVQAKDARAVAVGKGQLGTVRMHQRLYDEALDAQEDARRTFEQLHEISYVAVAWHQIGQVYELADQPDDAEKAYLESLRIRVQIDDRSGEAATLGQLGNLYDRTGRLEEAVRFYLQAAAVYHELNDLANEGRTCSNLAHTLVALGRYADARREILRAIECKESFGHVAEPWKTFAILANLEQADGNMVDAHAARQRAIDAYRAYRKDGGENLSTSVRVFSLVTQAIADNQIPRAEAQIIEFQERSDLPAGLKPVLSNLQSILRGVRDPSLATDPSLNYSDAVELEILLEHLASHAEG